MTYQGTMAMPKNAVTMQENEMRYVEGGVRIVYARRITHKQVLKIKKSTALADVIGALGLGGTPTMRLVAAALLSAKYQIIAADKINKGKGAYVRVARVGSRYYVPTILPW